jgi:hypothetical protein
MNVLGKAGEIESDLRTLCVEFGRIFPDVKQVRVLLDFKIRNIPVNLIRRQHVLSSPIRAGC